MTDERPRFPDELLADLHAGVLPPDVEAELWPQVHADPDAMAVIEALDRVSSTLGSLGSAGLSAHGEPMPADVAGRLDALFADPPPVTAPDPAPDAAVLPLRPRENRRPNRPLQWLAAAVALVAVLGGVGIWLGANNPSDDIVQANPSTRPTDTPLVLHGELGSDALVAAMGRKDAPGPLSNDQKLRECLTAVGIPEERVPLGSTSVIYEERPGVLILVSGPSDDVITALIVNPECAPGNAISFVQRDI